MIAGRYPHSLPIGIARYPWRGTITVLLTGFEPFQGEVVNPSWELAQALDGEEIAGHRVVAVQLPCVFGASLAVLREAIARHDPALVLAIGQAGGRSQLSLERVAINIDDARIPDNAGAQPIDVPVVADGAPAYFSRLPIKAMLAALQQAGIPALMAEVESAAHILNLPAARLIVRGEARLLLLEEVEALQASDALVVDACRHVVRLPSTTVSLSRRPVLFALVRVLAEAWPADVPRGTLVARAFGARHADESHRARLRVELGRLRTMLRTVASISATKRGFALAPHGAAEVVVLARPVEEQHGAVLAFLTDGESWSSSSLALALGASQRSVQRALDSLAATGKVQSFGRGPARRWTTPPVPGFTTTLLLPSPLLGE